MKKVYERPLCNWCLLCAEDILNLSLEPSSELTVVEKSGGENWDW